jgi:hypothetical protein
MRKVAGLSRPGSRCAECARRPCPAKVRRGALSQFLETSSYLVSHKIFWTSVNLYHKQDSRSNNKMAENKSLAQDLFEDMGRKVAEASAQEGEDDTKVVDEIESLCMNCHEDVCLQHNVRDL